MRTKTYSTEEIQRRTELLKRHAYKRWLVRKQPTKWVLSFSGGKDSTAMLHVILREKLPLDEVIIYDSGWEFPELNAHMRLVEQKTGVSIRRIVPTIPWEDQLMRWGWPHWGKRWCTGDKGRALDRNTRGKGKYIGLAADEAGRAEKYKRNAGQVQHVRFPLIDAGITSAQAMQMCRELGYNWGGLYDILPRFSCYCCPLMRWSDLCTIMAHRPRVYDRIVSLHAKLPNERREKGWKQGRPPEWIVTSDWKAVRARGKSHYQQESRRACMCSR